MSIRTYAAMIDWLHANDVDRLSSRDVVDLVVWADGYSFELEHAADLTPENVAAAGWHIVLGAPAPSWFHDRPQRHGAPPSDLDWRRSQWEARRRRLAPQVFARDGHRCCSCGRRPDDDDVDLTVDHVIPLASDGSDDLDNLQTLCRSCNSRKRDR